MSRSPLFVIALGACSVPSHAKPDAPFLDAPADGRADAPIDAPPIVETPLDYAGGTYTQTFDGLPKVALSSDMIAQTLPGRGPLPFSLLTGNAAASGMDGWEMANPTGSSADTEFRIHDGSLSGSDGRGIVSFGSDASTERALGTLPTTNQVGVFGVLLKNTTSGTLTQLAIAFNGEQWRRGDVAMPDTLTFEYGIADSLDAPGLMADPALLFTAPTTSGTDNALDGNASANRQALNKTVTGVTWMPGTTLVLRWTPSVQSGKDDALAVDDFTFSAL